MSIMRIVLLTTIVFISFTTLAQTRKLTGKVNSSDDGSALSGVSVTVKGTRIGAATDAKGEFSIMAAPGATLILSYVGFENKEVSSGTGNTVAVQLIPSNNNLNTVVVIGYGTQKKRSKPQPSVLYPEKIL